MTRQGWTWDELAALALALVAVVAVFVACEWWQARGRGERRRWS